jgi:hypothetical protein
MLVVLVSHKSIKSPAIKILRKRIGAQDDVDIYFLCESNVSLKRKVFWLVVVPTYSCATAHDSHMVSLVITEVILFSNRFTKSKGKDSWRRCMMEWPI